MSKLITTLIEEHKALVETLDQVKTFGISTEKGRLLLLSAKNAFLAHLKKEDDKLYPTLVKAAETDEDISKMLEIFFKEMDKISAVAVGFFTKYTAENASGFEFARDFGNLYATLKNRVRKEELRLYAKYDQLVA